VRRSSYNRQKDVIKDIVGDNLARQLIQYGRGVRRQLSLHPEHPDPQTVMNLSLHEALEQELSRPGMGADSPIERAWDVLEGFRGSALEYWMAITPPPYPDSAMNAAGRSFEREEDRLSWTGGVDALPFPGKRGAVPVVARSLLSDLIRTFLPEYFQRYAAEVSVFFQRKGPRLGAKTGREEYKAVQELLRGLYEQMAESIPQYTRKRMQSHASWRDMIRAASSIIGAEQWRNGLEGVSKLIRESKKGYFFVF
jgi:hypothetical protein